MRNSRRTRLVLTILLLAAFSLITLDYRTGAMNGVRKAASDVFGPVENGVSAVTHPIGSFFSSLGHLNSYKHDNADLKAEVARLQGKLRLTAAQRAELAQMQKLLHLAGLAQFKVVAARVTSYGTGLGFDETVTINRGTANGIQANQTVITGDGLVGRTLSPVGRNSATVLLANDPTFAVGTRIAGPQLELGSVQGGGLNKPMDLQLYSNNTPLSVNEGLVTAGDQQNGNRPFVPEVPIGTITHVNPMTRGLAETAVVKPYVNFTALNIVAVVVSAPKSIKHDSLLPASPTPAPTVTVTVTATPGSTPTGTTSSTGTSTSPNPTASTSP